MSYPPNAFGAPPWKGGAASGPAEPDPRRPLGRIRWTRRAAHRLALAGFVLALAACTQERQNEIKRSIQNWTGTNGVLEVYAGDKVVKRFLQIDKLSTALGTDDKLPRSYRYGYGVLDENLNGVVDPGEKRVYFEVGDFSHYVFFESPR